MAAANGRPADPDEYEVTNLTCTPDPDNSDVIIVTFKLTNTATEQRLFEVEFLIERSDGTYHNQHRTLFDRYLSPGESLVWDSVVVKGDDNPPDANCDIQILDSPFEVFDQ